MNISHIIVHAQQVEESRLRRKNREDKRAKSFETGSSKGRLKIQDKSRFKKRFSNQVTSKFPKARDDKLTKPRSEKGNNRNSPNENPTSTKCGKGNFSEYLV